MCFGRVLPEIPIESVPLLLRRSIASSLLFILILVFLVFRAPDRGAVELMFDKGPLLLPVYCTLVIYIASGTDFLLRPKIMENRVAAWLGAMSGELFLLHWPLRLLLYRMWEDNPIVLTLIFQFVVSAISHEFNKCFWQTKKV